MSVKGFELRKVISSPLIYALLLLFLAFNVLPIIERAHIRNELAVINQLVQRFGHEMTEEMQADFQAYYRAQLDKMNEITGTKSEKKYVDAASFFQEHPGWLDPYARTAYLEKGSEYSKEELDSFFRLLVVEIIYKMMQEADEVYRGIDLSRKAEEEIAKYGLGGKAADTVRAAYAKLQKRLEQLVANGEHKHLFFPGKIFEMHSLLFEDLFRRMIFEMTVLSVLITGYLCNYEFERQTHLVAYSTKRGRKLALDKLLASLTATAIVTTVIVVGTLAVYFATFPYSGLMKVPISSYFNMEDELPYISWWNMTFDAYLMCAVVLMYACGLLFSSLTFVLSAWIRNSYLAFFSFIALFGIFVGLPGWISTDSNMIFLAHYTPFVLILNPFLWFTGGLNPFTAFKGYETVTVLVWSALLTSLSQACMYRFRKQDIH